MALVLAIAGCGGSGTPRDAHRVLRASATHGLPPFEVGASGATGYALDLQYVPPVRLAEVVSVEGRHVVIHERTGIAYSTATLAQTLRCKGGQTVTRRADELTVLVSSDEIASRFTRMCGFDLGPFQLESQDVDNGVLTLRARKRGPIDEIQIVAVPPEDEWRRLLGRDIDVIPLASGIDRSEFDGLSSVRTITLPQRSVVTVVFDMRWKPLQAEPVRRAIMQSVDRQAVARLVCPSGCDEPGSEPDDVVATVAEDLSLPPTLELMLPDVEPYRTVAAYIQYTLARRGVDVSLRPLPPGELLKALEPPFQMVLMPGRQADGMISRLRNFNFGHWQSADFEAAMDAGDLDAARKVVARELPGFVVGHFQVFAAVDARLCGGEPKSAMSWDWLAELHPCEGGRQ